MTKTWCVGSRHMSNTIKFNKFEKLNLRTKKLVKIIRGNGTNRGRDGN